MFVAYKESETACLVGMLKAKLLTSCPHCLCKVFNKKMSHDFVSEQKWFSMIDSGKYGEWQKIYVNCLFYKINYNQESFIFFLPLSRMVEGLIIRYFGRQCQSIFKYALLFFRIFALSCLVEGEVGVHQSAQHTAGKRETHTGTSNVNKTFLHFVLVYGSTKLSNLTTLL